MASKRRPGSGKGASKAGAKWEQGTAPDSSRFLSTFLGTHIRVTQNVAIAALERAFAPLHMSPTRYALLVHARELPGATQTQLAELIGADRSTIVPMLNDMERRGLIHRVRALVDRRATEIRITPKGRTLLRRLIPLAEAHERRMTRGLSAADRATLGELLAALRRNLQAD